MTTWIQGFCIGSIVTAIIGLLICVYSGLYLSGTISQTQEEHEQQ